MRPGFLDHLPRTRELILNFLIARSARCIVNVKLQLNEFTVEDAVGFIAENVPFNSGEGYRIDAGALRHAAPDHLRHRLVRGKVQIDRLVADRSRQLGADFDLGELHDAFLAAGAIPVALTRWEMTGFDDEVQSFWEAAALQ